VGKIAHLFCSASGIESFGRGEGPGGVRRAAINVRCLDDFEVFALSPIEVNGKAFLRTRSNRAELLSNGAARRQIGKARDFHQRAISV
jgi:hypothetical protein